MDGDITNITANILILAGLIIISGTHIWILSSEPLDEHMTVTISSSNLAACLATAVGSIITQLHIHDKKKAIKSLLFSSNV